MFTQDGPCFLLVPNEQNQRLLLPGKVRQMTGGKFVVQFDEPAVMNPGDEALVLAEWRQKFLQQSIKIERVWTSSPQPPMTIDPQPEADSFAPLVPATEYPAVAVEATAEKPVIEFTTNGEAISAEQRGSYRVSVAACDIFAKIGTQQKCHVVDVSPEGLAVIAKSLTVGRTVEVSLTYAGITVEGALTVQTMKELRSGKLRYGLCAPNRKSFVRVNLQKLTMMMQRDQLKRLAGAA